MGHTKLKGPNPNQSIFASECDQQDRPFITFLVAAASTVSIDEIANSHNVKDMNGQSVLKKISLSVFDSTIILYDDDSVKNDQYFKI